MSHVEVDEKSERLIRETQVGEKLGQVNRQNLLYRLNLYDHNFFNKKIYSVARVQLNAVVYDGKEQLRPNYQARFREFVFKAGLIDVFQQTGPKS